MHNINKMSKLEWLLESRLEAACEKNEWVATAKILCGTQIGSLVIEKFSKDPIDAKDRRDAFMSLCDFIIEELNIHYMENEKVFTEDAETIPNTISPYHYTITAKIDIYRWLAGESSESGKRNQLNFQEDLIVKRHAEIRKESAR